MFKDYDKYLSQSLRVYLFVLIIIFIMKLVGLDYFGLDVNNVVLTKISNYLSNTHWGDLYWFTTVFIQFYLYLCLVCKKRKLYIQALIGSILNYSGQIFLVHFFTMDWLYYILCFSLMIFVPMIVNKNISIKRQFKYILILSLYQLISMCIRNVGINENYRNFLLESLLNIDQLLMLAITYNIYFMKGGTSKCGEEVEAGYSSLKQINLKQLQTKLQEKLLSFKKLDKVSRITFIIYFILTMFWNILSFVIVLLVARLNDTFIECIFILTSFWLSKRVFGKAFHLKSMSQCFIISNLTYYFLNRITTPLGISILIPIMLGVGLSYFTSKLVKKTYKPLYKGMSKELFEETILKVVDKDSDKYKICYDYFINKKNALYLAGKYNYTEAGIRKIKDRVNNKIKELK